MKILIKSLLPANSKDTKWALLGLAFFSCMVILAVFNIATLLLLNSPSVEAATIMDTVEVVSHVQFDMDSYKATLDAFKRGVL